ncbi:MAG: winged helix-turn-helix transcriptional regulator [Myxococcales bacterium]|nr:winged helix-turn-helix transcriptional regulator [Myxococcales bacterium]
MWTFLSNHAHVLVCLRQDPDLRARDLADRVGITERAIRRILHDLEVDGYIEIEKRGRRNHYQVCVGAPMRHPVEAGVDVGSVLDVIVGQNDQENTTAIAG